MSFWISKDWMVFSNELSSRTKIDLWSAVYPFMTHRFYCLGPNTNSPISLESGGHASLCTSVTQYSHLIQLFKGKPLSHLSWRGLIFLKAANFGNTKLKCCHETLWDWKPTTVVTLSAHFDREEETWHDSRELQKQGAETENRVRQ